MQREGHSWALLDMGPALAGSAGRTGRAASSVGPFLLRGAEHGDTGGRTADHGRGRRSTGAQFNSDSENDSENNSENNSEILPKSYIKNSKILSLDMSKNSEGFSELFSELLLN